MQIPAYQTVNLEKIISTIESVGYPVFAIDLNKDEINKHDSFFVYMDKGNIINGESKTQLLRDFTLMYLSKNNKDIDEIDLILNLRKLGLIFDSMDRDEAKFQDTDQTALVLTFHFHATIRACY